MDQYCCKISYHTPADMVISEIYPGSLEPFPQHDHHCTDLLLDRRYNPAADTIPGVFPGKNILFSRKIYLLVPVALYGWGILCLLSGGLGDMKLPVTIYTVVILGMLLAAVSREKKVNRQSFLLVLAGAILFVLSYSMIAINKFSQPFELARIAIMSSYITAQYLIAIGCTRQYNLTLK
jgi:hypothetical protein